MQFNFTFKKETEMEDSGNSYILHGNFIDITILMFQF